ncbi:hypothetical protein ACHAQJ_005728 [Trichoderma viride]
MTTPQQTDTDTDKASASDVESSSSSSPVPAKHTSSPRLHLSRTPVSSLPSKRDRTGLAFYHHFITTAASRLFDLDYIPFWRDQVASIAWTNDIVFEAVLALGGIHQASLLSASGLTTGAMIQSKVFGLRSYGEALHLIASHTNKDSCTDMLPAVVAVVLLAYCECIMNHPNPALLHLRAAVKLSRTDAVPDSPGRHVDYTALQATLARLDFLAQSIVPYSQPSLREDSPNACNYNTAPYSFVGRVGRRSISSERVELVQIISSFNHLENIIWGPWSSTASRPSLETLSRFQMELLHWRTRSQLTFESCSESLAVLPDCNEPLDELPIPPDPLLFQNTLAAITVALYNNYMACSFSMLSNGPNVDRNAICAFHFVYQNLRIAQGLNVEALDEHENIDISTSLLLYLGFRRCYSDSWQKWTVQKLRQCGRQGLLDGSAFANTLENMYHVQLRAELQSNNTRTPSDDNTGLLHTRTLPLLQPRDDSDNLVAYYLKPTVAIPGQEDVILRTIARVTWKQDKFGNIATVNFEFYDDFAVIGADTPKFQGWNPLSENPFTLHQSVEDESQTYPSEFAF